LSKLIELGTGKNNQHVIGSRFGSYHVTESRLMFNILCLWIVVSSC